MTEQKSVKQYMMEDLIMFGKMYQLQYPDPDYVEVLQIALRNHGWTLGNFRNALNQLTYDDTYAETAKFGKYPTIHDFLRIKKQSDSQPFYSALSAYLSGDWREKDTIKQIATPEQHNAILLAGGLENLYARATGDKPTPICKLVALVAKNESEVPATRIDTTHRVGGPASMQQITQKVTK